MTLNGSNIGILLKWGQNRPFFHPLFFEENPKFWALTLAYRLDFGLFQKLSIYVMSPMQKNMTLSLSIFSKTCLLSVFFKKSVFFVTLEPIFL